VLCCQSTLIIAIDQSEQSLQLLSPIALLIVAAAVSPLLLPLINLLPLFPLFLLPCRCRCCCLMMLFQIVPVCCYTVAVATDPEL